MTVSNLQSVVKVQKGQSIKKVIVSPVSTVKNPYSFDQLRAPRELDVVGPATNKVQGGSNHIEGSLIQIKVYLEKPIMTSSGRSMTSLTSFYREF